ALTRPPATLSLRERVFLDLLPRGEGAAQRRMRVLAGACFQTALTRPPATLSLRERDSFGLLPQGAGAAQRRMRVTRTFDSPAIIDHRRERLAVDELHGVVVHAALAAHGVDRDDVRVVELGGGQGLGLEPAELDRVHRRREGKDLERHTAVERDLLGLVNYPIPPR